MSANDFFHMDAPGIQITVPEPDSTTDHERGTLSETWLRSRADSGLADNPDNRSQGSFKRSRAGSESSDDNAPTSRLAIRRLDRQPRKARKLWRGGERAHRLSSATPGDDDESGSDGSTKAYTDDDREQDPEHPGMDLTFPTPPRDERNDAMSDTEMGDAWGGFSGTHTEEWFERQTAWMQGAVANCDPQSDKHDTLMNEQDANPNDWLLPSPVQNN